MANFNIMEDMEEYQSSQDSALGEEDLQNLEKASRPASTSAATKSSMTKFKDWLVKRGKMCNFHTVTEESLSELLRSFYAEVKNYKTGHALSPSTLTGIRAAIHRYITAAPYLRRFNIVKDSVFLTANNMLGVRCRLFYRDGGNPKPQHKAAIQPTDLQKLGVYFEAWEKSPCVLVEAVWFELCYHFGRRGREGWTSMTKSTFTELLDSAGMPYLTMKNTEKTKNYQGGNKQKDQDYSDVRMYGSGVAIYRFYISKLSPKCDRLFQTPRSGLSVEGPWFKAEPMGKNTMTQMMPRISEKAGLSQRYTCHCVRATTITTLFQSGVPAEQIVAITKHKDTKSLKPYISGLMDAQKRGCSSTLSKALHLDVDAHQV